MGGRSASTTDQKSTRERVRELFAQAGFRQLVATRVASQFGDGLFQLATAKLLLFDHPGPNPALRLTALVAITLIPFSVVIPFVGVFIDRWDRRKILVYTPVARAAIAALLPATIIGGDATPAFYVVGLIVLSGNRLFLATASAVLPNLVPENDLLVGNSAAATGGSIATVSGLGAGAVLAAILGGSWTALFAAAAFAAAALLAMRVPVGRDVRRAHEGIRHALGRILSELAYGFRTMRLNRRVRYALSAIVMGQFLVGVMTAGATVVFIARLHLGVGSVSTLLGAIGIGLGFGVVIVPLVARRVREDLILPLAFAIGGAGVLTTSASLTRTSMTLGGIVVGVSYAFAKIPTDTIVQEEMNDDVRGRAFSVYDMLFNVARVAGTATAAALVAAEIRLESIVTGTGFFYFFASAGLVVWARRIVGMKRLRSIRSRIAETPAPATQSFALPAGEMVTVRAYAGSRSDEEPRAVVVGGSEVPVDLIEWRAVEERDGERRRVFVCHVGGSRVRLAHIESSSLWEIERILDPPSRVDASIPPHPVVEG